MKIDDLGVAAEAEAIADARGNDFGSQLREDLAAVLHCNPDELHPDKGRRLDT
jgi:hypothetical protein